MPQNNIDDKSTLIQVMAWSCQASGYFLSQCYLNFMSSYGITRLQWVNSGFENDKPHFFMNASSVSQPLIPCNNFFILPRSGKGLKKVERQ